MNTQTEQEFTRNDYMLLHGRCAVCYWEGTRKGRWLELHHIVGGPGRKDIVENWLSLCCRCHAAVHDRLPDYGELSKGAILTAKWQEDGEFDPAILAALKHRKALPYSAEPIPDKFLEDRMHSGGKPWPA